MAHYIVYSGGAQGYRLYAADAEFPEEYREPIEKLYAARCVATNHSVIPRCYRFSPIKDRYVFSVIYKGCVCEGESRSFFATVNFLLTTKEADSFWGHFKHDVAMLIEKADEILLKEGYSIPRPTPIISEYRDKITVTAQQALLSAAHYAMLAGSLPKNELSAQVFLGCEQEDDLFSPVCWLSNVIPKHMRRHISFHIGAFVAEETRDVSLVVS